MQNDYFSGRKPVAILLITFLTVALLSGCLEKPKTGVQPVPTATVKPTESTQEFEVIPQKEPEGTVTLSCESALYPLAARWGGEFMKLHPGTRVEVSAGGSMDDALNGLADIRMVSRDADSSEIERGAYPIAVAKDAVIRNGTSPPSRVEYFVTKGRPDGLKAEFIRWVLTGGQKYLEEEGYTALSREKIDDELRKIE